MTKNPRIIAVEGVKNFRDMGGYEVIGGKRIKRGKLFRSGHLSAITDAGRAVICEHSITTVVDFRSPREKERHPTIWTDAWRPMYRETPIGGNAAAWIQEMYARLRDTDFPARELRDQLLDAFRTIPVENTSGLKGYFDSLLDLPTDGALLFHCTAGKDRTGIAAILTMTALGANEDTILEEFLLTNEAVDLEAVSADTANWLSSKSGRTIKPSDVLPLVGVEQAFLEALYSVLHDKYGGVENYLTDQMGLTDEKREKLQVKLLEIAL